MQGNENGKDIPAGTASQAAATPDLDGTEGPSRPRRASGARWYARCASFAGAAVLTTGVGFGAASLVAGSGRPAPVSSAIPSPATGSGAFQEDDNLTGQDNQDNILQATAPGMVHIMSGRTSVGIGIVLTPSGKVLTTYRPGQGARDLAAKYVLSGATFKAQVIGTDDGLALLQLQGGDRRTFSTVTVGNSATLADSAYNSQEVSYHITGEVLDTAVGTRDTGASITIDLGTLVNLSATAAANGGVQHGLMESVLQSSPAAELGGPLADLNGRVIGITVAAAGSGRTIHGYAIPINTALAIAAHIDACRAGCRG